MGEYNDPISSGEALSAAAPSGAVAVGSAGADAGIIEPPLSRSLHVAMLPARIAAFNRVTTVLSYLRVTQSRKFAVAR